MIRVKVPKESLAYQWSALAATDLFYMIWAESKLVFSNGKFYQMFNSVFISHKLTVLSFIHLSNAA